MILFSFANKYYHTQKKKYKDKYGILSVKLIMKKKIIILFIKASICILGDNIKSNCRMTIEMRRNFCKV
jgi:hypothetical protein